MRVTAPPTVTMGHRPLRAQAAPLTKRLPSQGIPTAPSTGPTIPATTQPPGGLFCKHTAACVLLRGGWAAQQGNGGGGGVECCFAPPALKAVVKIDVTRLVVCSSCGPPPIAAESSMSGSIAGMMSGLR